MFSGRGRRGRGATRGDNEIEMAKADHRIGWLNGGGAEAGRRTRGLIRTAAPLCNGSCKRASCCSKLILNFNIALHVDQYCLGKPCDRKLSMNHGISCDKVGTINEKV